MNIAKQQIINAECILKISMGEWVVVTAPCVIISEGVGSCVAVTLYETKQRLGGMAHVMLPHLRVRSSEFGVRSDKKQRLGTEHGSQGNKTMQRNNSVVVGIDSELRTPNSELPCQYADVAIHLILEEMLERGAEMGRIVAKMAGGARMFLDYGNTGVSIGERNIAGIKQILKKRKIPLIGHDTGGSHGRTVLLKLETGIVTVKSLEFPDKEI